MEVTCPACAARYTANEDKLRGKTARMRCRACNTVWLVSGPVAGQNNAFDQDDPIALDEPTAARSNVEPGRAAVVKRGAEREHRDLFASRPLDIGSVKQTLRPGPVAGHASHDEAPLSSMAARNENSVLFTVDALRSQDARNARVNTPAPEPAPLSGFIVGDDEGIIDLNALASVPPKVGSRSIAPVFSDPPPAAFASDVPSGGGFAQGSVAMPGGFRLSKRALAGAAAAMVALVLFSVGVRAAFKGEEAVTHAAANTMIAPVTPAVAPAPVSPAPAAPEQATASSSSSSSSDEDKAEAKPAKKGKRKAGAGAAKASFAPSKASTTVSIPKAPKASDKCGCKGNFDCIIRCSATGK